MPSRPQIAKIKIELCLNFKEKTKIHETKIQNLLSEEVANRYGLESFSSIHKLEHSQMSSLDYFKITSFPIHVPQLSKNDLIDMFLLDHKEIRDDSVCVSLHLFFHDQYSNVFLTLSEASPVGAWGLPMGVRGLHGADQMHDRRTPPPQKNRGKNLGLSPPRGPFCFFKQSHSETHHNYRHTTEATVFRKITRVSFAAPVEGAEKFFK